jgi:hypothetical protein
MIWFIGNFLLIYVLNRNTYRAVAQHFKPFPIAITIRCKRVGKGTAGIDVQVKNHPAKYVTFSR